MLILYIDMGTSSHRYEEMSVDCRYCFYRGVSLSHSTLLPVALSMRFIGGLHFVFLHKSLETHLDLLSQAFPQACLLFLFRISSSWRQWAMQYGCA